MDPFEQLLLGPTYATAKVLAQAGLTLQDMDVIEVGCVKGWEWEQGSRPTTRRLSPPTPRLRVSLLGRLNSSHLTPTWHTYTCHTSIHTHKKIHEAFAGQVLSNLRALASDKFAQVRKSQPARLSLFVSSVCPCVLTMSFP